MLGFNNHVPSSEDLDEMIDYVTTHSHLSRDTCLLLIPLIFQAMRNCLLQGKNICIEGFARMKMININLKNNHKRFKIKFRPSKMLKFALNA